CAPHGQTVECAVGLLVQLYALSRALTLFANLACGLRVRPRQPPRSTPFPYTPLFRSARRAGGRERAGRVHQVDPGQLLRDRRDRSEEHTSELQSRENIVCRRLLEKKKLCLVPPYAGI